MGTGVSAATASLLTSVFRKFTLIPWNEISGKPSTVAGYGISDAFSGAYSDLTGKPATFPTRWGDVSEKPAVIAAGVDQAAARASIGAGTSNLALGTVAGTASEAGHVHGAATPAAAGFLSAQDKAKLDGIAVSANNYALPTANASTPGGVRQGPAVANVLLVPTAADFNALLNSLRVAGVIAS